MSETSHKAGQLEDKEQSAEGEEYQWNMGQGHGVWCAWKKTRKTNLFQQGTKLGVPFSSRLGMPWVHEVNREVPTNPGGNAENSWVSPRALRKTSACQDHHCHRQLRRYLMATSQEDGRGSKQRKKLGCLLRAASPPSLAALAPFPRKLPQRVARRGPGCHWGRAAATLCTPWQRLVLQRHRTDREGWERTC